MQAASQMLIGKEQWMKLSPENFPESCPYQKEAISISNPDLLELVGNPGLPLVHMNRFPEGGQQLLPFFSALLRDWFCNAEGKQTCLAPFCCWLGEAMVTHRYSQNPELPWLGLHSRWFYLCSEDPWGPDFGVCSILFGVWGQFIFKFFNDIDSSKWNRQQIALDETCLSFQLTLI